MHWGSKSCRFISVWRSCFAAPPAACDVAQHMQWQYQSVRSFCLVKSRGFVHLAALGLVSIVLHYVTVNTVVLVSLTGMRKTDCSGETRLVLHIPSSP
jgi:hypothetical protein